MIITVVAETSFTGCYNRTCIAEFWHQVNDTYIQKVKMNTLQNDIKLINSSIKELLQSYKHKPPNARKTRMTIDQFLYK